MPISAKQIESKIAYLQQQLEDMRAAEQEQVETRQRLLAFVKKEGFTRADLAWVYAQLPAMFITRKMRERRLQGGKSVHPSKTISAAAAYYEKKGQPPAEFAKALREAIAAANVNYQEVAKALGVHSSLVSAWCKGGYWPRPERVAALNKYLRVKLPEKPDKGPPPSKTKKYKKTRMPGKNPAFGKWVTENRTAKNLARRDLARAVGVDDSLIAFWEDGSWYPGAVNAEKLTKLFGSPIPPKRS